MTWRRRRRRNVGQSFRRSCSAASALLQVPRGGYQDGFLSDCREEPERRERAEIRARRQEEEEKSDPRKVQNQRELHKV